MAPDKVSEVVSSSSAPTHEPKAVKSQSTDPDAPGYELPITDAEKEVMGLTDDDADDAEPDAEPDK